MQNSEDDMNELFRRASKGFRLNLPDEDWDAIQKRLASNASAPISAGNNIRNRNNYKLLIIALFIYAIAGTTAYTVFNLHDRPQGLQKRATRFLNIDNGVNAVRNNGSRSVQVRSRSTIVNPAIPGNIPSKNEKKKDLAYSGIQDNKVIGNLSDPVEPTIHYPVRINAAQTAATTKAAATAQNTTTEQAEATVQTAVTAQTPAKISNTPGKNSKKGSGIEKNNRFYIGIMAGPQLNNTKEQEFSQPVISAGLLAGYRLNGKLAIETGFFISDKKYRSAGAYFDMSKISATMPAGMKVLSVESKSTVLEIPLRIKYDWLKLKRGELFGTAGLSSYILTKESNHYLGSINGGQEDLSGNYSQSQKYFAAAVNVSAGYQFTTGRGVTLRIEPYIQVPVKKIGVGSLPVLSAGVYLGVTIPLSN